MNIPGTQATLGT